LDFRNSNALRIFLLFLFPLVIACQYSCAQPVNTVIGDSSWLQAFGSWPDANSPEKLRIQSHLAQAINIIEAAPGPAHLEKQRKHSIRLLKEYLRQGEFPRQFNYAFAERHPCFIDDKGRLCAVGYLIAETVGRAESERINASFRFHYLLDIKDSLLEQWQKASGLSMRELAMVQPAYTPAKKFYRHRSKLGLIGLRYSSTNFYAILPRYKALYNDPDQTFFWAQSYKGWKVYTSRAWPINFHHYDTVFLWQGHKNLNLLVTGKNVSQAFNEKGKSRFKLEGIEVKTIVDSFFIAEKRAQMGVFNWEGEEIIPANFDIVEPIYSLAAGNRNLHFFGSKTLAGFKIRKNGYWGIIDKKGDWIIKAEWDAIHHERGLYFARSQLKGERLFKLNGVHIELSDLESIEQSICNYCSMVNLKGRRGVFDGYRQEWAIKPHKMITSKNRNTYLIQDENNKWGMANAQGYFLFPCRFDSIEVFEQYAILKDSSQILLTSLRGDTITYGSYSEVGLFARSETEKSTTLFYAKGKGDVKIINERGEEKFQELDIIDLETTGKSLVLIHRAEGKVLAQFQNNALKLYPQLNIDLIKSVGPYYYIYQSEGKLGVGKQYYGQEIDSSSFKLATFDSLIPLPGPSDFSLYLAKKNAYWGVYDAKKDSIIIDIDQVDFFPKKLTTGGLWIYFIDANSVWKGYYYTSPKLHYLMPAAQRKLTEQYLASEQKN
jgi:hypothetical protein